jgi:hypothetical protein
MTSEESVFAGSSWADLLGPGRRGQAWERMRERCWIGVDDEEPFISAQVDRECLEMAYVLLALISPVTAPGRDREAMIVYGALSAIFDTAATSVPSFRSGDLLRRGFRGRPIGEWAEQATAGVDEWTRSVLLEAFQRQIAQLSENRVEQGIGPTRQREFRNTHDYRSYLRWRIREGWYYGGLLACAVVAGVDLREIPKVWIEETLEASVLAFDTHGWLRHAYEDEIAHTLNYLPGTQHQKISAGLEAYNEILFRIQDADDLRPDHKAYLMSFVSGLVTANYACARYARTTPLHIARVEDVTEPWTHVRPAEAYRYTHPEVAGEA